MERPAAPEPISLRLTHSPNWCALLAIAYAGAGLSLSLAGLWWPVAAAASLALAGLAVADIRVHALRRGRSAVVGLRSLPGAKDWHLILRDGRQLKACQPEVRLNHPLLVVLHFSGEGSGERWVFVQRDAAAPAAFRRLRIQLGRS